MLGGNSFITVWNRVGAKHVRREVPVKCRFTHRSIRNTSGVGDTMTANIAGTIICRIPYCKNYLPPEVWLGTDDTGREGFFTVRTDDYIALGVHKYEIGNDRDAGNITVPELRRKLSSQIMQVKAVRYSLQTALGKHIRAEGV